MQRGAALAQSGLVAKHVVGGPDFARVALCHARRATDLGLIREDFDGKSVSQEAAQTQNLIGTKRRTVPEAPHYFTLQMSDDVARGQVHEANSRCESRNPGNRLQDTSLRSQIVMEFIYYNRGRRRAKVRRQSL